MSAASSQQLAAVSAGLRSGGALVLQAPSEQTGFDGRRMGRANGHALEFSEYREYRPGDDLRRLDWGVYARSEQLMVKLFREEIDPRCDLIIDDSASMNAGAGFKRQAALALAAMLACAADNSGFTLKVWKAGGEVSTVDHPAKPMLWPEFEFAAPFSPAEALDNFHGRFQSRGLRVVISDLLWDGEPRHFLSRVAAGGTAVVILQVLEKGDREIEAGGNWRLTDAESGEEREVMLDEARVRRYLQRLERHLEWWRNEARQSGIELLTLDAEDFYPECSVAELVAKGVVHVR